MIAKFKMELTEDKFGNAYNGDGVDLRETAAHHLEIDLEKYLLEDGSLSASQIEADWFPQFDAHVFISHSHADEQKALNFAGYLWREYKIKSFIDSAVWGHSNDLLKKYDDVYCVDNKNADEKSLVYSYEKRNQSTAHIHMLLQAALSKMIDHCECLIFINTPNSIKFSNKDLYQTASPWIYNELHMANILRLRSLDEHRERKDTTSFFYLLGGEISYNVKLNTFVDLETQDFEKAAAQCKNTNPETILTQLYLNKGILTKQDY